MGTKFERWKKIKNDEIKNNFEIEYFFQIKKIIIKRTWTKYDGKRNSRVDVIFSRGKQEWKKVNMHQSNRITMHAPLKKKRISRQIKW
jgi:hypothetical protein